MGGIGGSEPEDRVSEPRSFSGSSFISRTPGLKCKKIEELPGFLAYLGLNIDKTRSKVPILSCSLDSLW